MPITASLNAPNILNAGTRKALLCQLGLIVAATALPAICHLTGAPVKYFLPMHWPVLLAGLVYGWRGGLAVGLLAPLASFALSGMPPLAVMPFMGPEIAAYGLSAGLAAEVFKMNRYACILTAVATGRMVYIAAVLGMGSFAANTYLPSALVPGAVAALAQIVILPVLAEKWTKHND